MQDHIIICGLGNIGFRTFEILVKAKQKIVVISNVVHDEVRWQVEAAGGVLYLGDARNDQLLIQAGIREAKAILALTDQDMVNTTIAMDARNLNPKIRIIVRMLDTELGSHISKAFGIHQVFSTSELAAPIFARSIIDHANATRAQFDLDGNVYLVSEKTNETNEPASKTTFPDSLKVDPTSQYKPKKTWWRFILGKFNYLRSPAFVHFRLFLFILLCVIILATVFLTREMPLPLVDALYFVMTTVTTVGYGDINFLHSSAALKLFGCFLMLMGATAIAVLFSSITEIILSKKLPSVLGGLPVPKKNHVIVVGAGHIGHRIVTTLIEDQVPVVIIEDDVKNRYSADVNRQVALVEGYLRSNDTLIRARVHTAKAIFVITEDDIENLSISLAAKKINPEIVNIIQVYNAKLGDKLQSALALDRVLSVANIAAPYFAAAVFGGEILVAMKWQNKLLFLSRGGEKQTEVEAAPFQLGDKTYSDIRMCSIAL